MKSNEHIGQQDAEELAAGGANGSGYRTKG
jgi:hypothetical protein